MQECVFCKIVNKQIPAFKIFENEKFIAILDIKPIAKGHALIIPKTHYETIQEMPETDCEQLLQAFKKVSSAIVKALKADGFNIGLNNGKAAGQEIMHCHWHIIPRFNNDGLKSWPQTSASEQELKKIHEQILNVLNSQELPL